MMHIPIVVAFLGGLVSFLSPCVLPIIPGFLAYLAGASLADAGAKRRAIVMNSIAFVFGFATVFALAGVLLNTVLDAVAYDAQAWFSRIGGAIIILFGLSLTGLIRIAFLERQHQLQVRSRFASRYLTSFVFGAAFAIGWTPCVGAVLGGILALATSSPGIAFSLLLAYALGLGIPFIIVGCFAAPAARLIDRYAASLRYVTVAFGILLIVMGILVFTQELSRLASFELVNRLLLRP